jgi:hypothetical protein
MRVYEINFSCHTSIYQLAFIHPQRSFSSTSSRTVRTNMRLTFASYTIQLPDNWKRLSYSSIRVIHKILGITDGS